MPFAPENLDIIMVAPRFAENIGAVARALANFGAGKLVLVRPNELTREGLAQRVARAGEDRLEQARIVATLAEALQGYDVAIATSHRHGRHRRRIEPWEAHAEVFARLEPRRIALVLGPEDHGLKREEMDLCHHLVCIDAQTPLNVAQTAVVLLYEWCGRRSAPLPCPSPSPSHPAAEPSAAGRAPHPSSDGDAPPSEQAPGTEPLASDDLALRPAPSHAGALLTAAAERGLQAVGYPRHRRPLRTEVTRLAALLERSRPSELEFRFLMGIFSHLEHLELAQAYAGDPQQAPLSLPSPGTTGPAQAEAQPTTAATELT